jgi:hypothetical protein
MSTYSSRVGVTKSGVILVAGAGGVQRSVDKGYTWTRTLIPDSPDYEVSKPETRNPKSLIPDSPDYKVPKP